MGMRIDVSLVLSCRRQLLQDVCGGMRHLSEVDTVLYFVLTAMNESNGIVATCALDMSWCSGYLVLLYI